VAIRQRRALGPRYDGGVARLTCPACGKRIFTTQPLEMLFGDERRCPQCGTTLEPERREVERRDGLRRQNPAHDPGPPSVERRTGDRRKDRRRRRPGGDAKKRSDWGWRD
jgi:ssDNA-binding Zn-finger/Zn-ribbon topoisomerase 1